jgi:hypothetical protein
MIFGRKGVVSRRRLEEITSWVSYVEFVVRAHGTIRRMRWVDV